MTEEVINAKTFQDILNDRNGQLVNNFVQHKLREFKENCLRHNNTFFGEFEIAGIDSESMAIGVAKRLLLLGFERVASYLKVDTGRSPAIYAVSFMVPESPIIPKGHD